MKNKPIIRILINSLIQIFIFGIISLASWDKSGGDIGLIIGGVFFSIIHLLVSFRWIFKRFDIFFQIIIGILIAGVINVISFNLQNSHRLEKFYENNPNGIIVVSDTISVDTIQKKIFEELHGCILIKIDTIDFTNLVDSNIEEYNIIESEMFEKIYSTNELKNYVIDNNLEPRLVGYRIHNNAFGILCITKYGQGNIADYIVFNNNSEYLGHFSPSYFETQPSYNLSTKGYFVNDLEYIQISKSERIEISENNRIRFIEYENKQIKYNSDSGFVQQVIDVKKDTLTDEFK
jgi:hypothetical protein